MLMFPISYLMSLAALVFAGYILTTYRSGDGQFWLVIFLISVAIQNIIIGTRFGYNIEELGRIQPFVAILIPPLTYLTFKRLKTLSRAWLHIIPIFIFGGLYLYDKNLIDLALGMSGIIYTIALIKLAMSDHRKLSWVKFGQYNQVFFLLIFMIAALFFSSITDSVIFFDFLLHDGANLKKIVTTASAIVLFCVILCLLFIKFTKKSNVPVLDKTEEKELKKKFEQIEQLMREKKIYLDPDLNLNRLAKRLRLPARDVSRAVNIFAKESLSHYVNRLRIEESCKMLKNSNTPITQVIYACGFNTKSNFNREFQRITGKNPSDWRKTNPIGL